MTAPVLLLGFPGPSMSFETSHSLYCASLRQPVPIVLGSKGSWDNFNTLWANALNFAAQGQITHFAMIHSDVQAPEGWADTLLDELAARDGDLISAAIPIKDSRGVCSCGIGDQDDPWEPFRRFTVRELAGLPETFDAAGAGYPDRWLLHNNGLWLADLRKPVFHQTDARGVLRAYFDFRREVYRDAKDGLLHVRGESEDWWFSRRLADLGAKTFLTSKVQVAHKGGGNFANFGDWGDYRDGDRDTAAKWKEPLL